MSNEEREWRRIIIGVLLDMLVTGSSHNTARRNLVLVAESCGYLEVGGRVKTVSFRRTLDVIFEALRHWS